MRPWQPLPCFLSCMLILFFLSSVPFEAGARQKVKTPFIVFVSVIPQHYFVQRVGGDRVQVHTLISPGHDPHTYTPRPGQMVRLSQAKLFFRTGIEFEVSLVQKIQKTMKQIRIVDLREGIVLRDILPEQSHAEKDADQGTRHGHDAADAAHHHAGKDPHIWLSPVLAKRQALTIRDALIAFDSSGSEHYRKNCDSFCADLDSLDLLLRNALAPVKGKTVFVFHPAFGYFTDTYGIVQEAVETGGKEPSAQALARLIDKAKARNARVIFVHPQYSPRAAQTIAEQIGGAVVSINPLPVDYIREMRATGEALLKGLSGNNP